MAKCLYMKTLELAVEGMHCNSCAALISDELQDLTGVKTADVSLENKRAVVEFDETQIKPSVIAETIESLGYTAETRAKNE